MKDAMKWQTINSCLFPMLVRTSTNFYLDSPCSWRVEVPRWLFHFARWVSSNKHIISSHILALIVNFWAKGGSTTTLVIRHAKSSDAGTYSLEAINRNGREKVELDLIVLDTLPECECLMFKTADKMCSCTHSYTG